MSHVGKATLAASWQIVGLSWGLSQCQVPLYHLKDPRQMGLAWWSPRAFPCLTSVRKRCFICLLFWDKVKQPNRIPLIRIFMDVCVCICFKSKTLQNPVISLFPSTALNPYLYLKAFLISKFIFPTYPMLLVPWPGWEFLKTPVSLNSN